MTLQFLKRLLPTHAPRPQTASAKVVDGKLILSFPESHPPTLWQMDFSAASLSSLRIESQNDTSSALILSAPKSDPITLATFPDHATALSHLVAISKTLQNSKGRIRTTPPAPGKTPTTVFKKLLLILGGLTLGLLGLTLINALWTSSTQHKKPPSGSDLTTPRDGVPMTADDYLKGR